MFKLIKGAKLSDNIKLKEAYEIKDNWIYANISTENIRTVFDKFIEIQKEYLFCLFIEIPADEDTNQVIGVSEDGYNIVEKTYKDIYYLDDLTAKTLKDLLDIFDNILINDGLSAFGVISQKGDEIGKYKYNMINAYSGSGNLSLFINLFNDIGIPKTDNLTTAWDYFSQDNPGESIRYEEDGKTIFDVVDTLKQVGMYMAERREE